MSLSEAVYLRDSLSLLDCLFPGGLKQFSIFEITTFLPSISEAGQEVQKRWEGIR